MTLADAGIVVARGSDESTLVVTVSSTTLRRDAGPVAWSALELLALSARPDAAGVLMVAIGVRELAAGLGVGRDAAAKALSRLRDLGLVSATQQRAGGGRFDGTRHTIFLPVVAEPSAAPRARSPRPPRQCKTTPPTSPSLFDEPTEPTEPSASSPARASDATVSDHSTQVPDEVPSKAHELAFDRMPTSPEGAGSGDGRSGGSSC